MLSVNDKALEITEEMMDWAEELKIESSQLGNGSTVIDCGVNVPGSYEAGRLFTEVCMGGYATTTITTHKVGDVPLAFIDVTTDQPSIACLGAQKAGWQLQVDKYFAMGSGPARALALKPKKTYDRIGYEDDSDYAVIALESAQLPDESVAEFIAKECGVDVGNVVMLVAPTACLVGSIQVAGRVVETGVFKINELGFDTTKIVVGAGTAPIAPVVNDDLKAMGSTNDAIIYYGSTMYTVNGVDEEIFKQVPSCTSKDYGKPFFITFKDAGYDFFKIDPYIFSPAEITVNDLETGKTFHTGYLNAEVTLESFGIQSL